MATHPPETAARYGHSGWGVGFGAAFVLSMTISVCILSAQDPPPGLARKVAHRETATQAERNQYAYRQTVRLQELDSRGGMTGEYREIRDVIFSPTHERTEVMVGKPVNTLQHLIMTDEDFHDIREIQPFVLTDERMFIYETKFRGEETVDVQHTKIDSSELKELTPQKLETQRLCKLL
jgi:hypothetical protein